MEISTSHYFLPVVAERFEVAPIQLQFKCAPLRHRCLFLNRPNISQNELHYMFITIGYPCQIWFRIHAL